MERKVLLTECMNRRVLALLEDEKVTEFHFGSSGEKKSCRLGEIYVRKSTENPSEYRWRIC